MNLLKKLTKPSPLKLSILIALICFAVQFNSEVLNNHLELLRTAELKVLDFKFVTRGEIGRDTDVVVAAMDEKSIQELGRWPWPRRIYARLLDALGEYQVKAAGFDMVLSDRVDSERIATLNSVLEVYNALDVPEGKPGEAASPQSVQFKEQIARMAEEADDDSILAAAFKRHRKWVVQGYFMFVHEQETHGITLDASKTSYQRIKKGTIRYLFEENAEQTEQGLKTGLWPVRKGNPIDDLAMTDVAGIQPPLDIFAKGGKHFGYFNALPDADGVLRRAPLLYRFGDRLLPSLSAEIVATGMGGKIKPQIYPYNPDIPPRLFSIDVGKAGSVPVNPQGILQINYYGTPTSTFPFISVADIIAGRVPKEQLKDKFVLIGATALGTFDQRVTPFDKFTPGVGVHATVVQNILDHTYLQRPDYMPLYELAILLFVGLFLGLFIPWVRMSIGGLLTILLAVGYFVLDQAFVFGAGYWIHTVLVILEILLIFIAITVYRYLSEEREKQFIKKAFQHYLSPAVVDQVTDDPGLLKLGGQRRDLTVLFSDIRSFTTISETLDPTELSNLLNEYLTPMTDIVFQTEGTLDKYMGDAVMAIFGAPLYYEDHAVRGCEAALQMMEKLHEMQADWRVRGMPVMDIGIGLNTGPMSVGNMGSAIRFDYTVMGDNVNLGSRLEGINKQYGTHIIVSEFTYAEVKEKIICRELDSVRVKGKLEPVVIYEVLARDTNEERELWLEIATMFEKGIKQYKAQQWDDSVATFEQTMELKPNDFASNLYIERCQQMKADPPGADWDGVYVMKTK